MYISKKNTRYKKTGKNYYNKKPQTSPQREVPLIVTEVTPSESLRIFIFSCSNFRICFLAVA